MVPETGIPGALNIRLLVELRGTDLWYSET